MAAQDLDRRLSETAKFDKQSSFESIDSLPLPPNHKTSDVLFNAALHRSLTSCSRRRCSSTDGFLRRVDGDNDSFTVEASNGLHAGLRQRKNSAKRQDTLRRLDQGVAKRRAAHVNPKTRWLIPAEHALKVLWDIFTMILSFANAYATHTSIRDRKFGSSPFIIFFDLWFLMDILLNFVTERKTADGEVLRDFKSVCARYLTSWFAVDALSLFPWESLYIKPIIDQQNRRGFFQKSFFRSRAVLRVTRHLRGRHFRWFGQVARHTKQHGIRAPKLLRLVIKYVPKYILFLRNMKGVIAFRFLRQIHWCRRFWKSFYKDEKDDGATGSLTRDDTEFDDDGSSLDSFPEGRHVKVEYEWEYVDDGVPL